MFTQVYLVRVIEFSTSITSAQHCEQYIPHMYNIPTPPALLHSRKSRWGL